MVGLKRQEISPLVVDDNPLKYCVEHMSPYE